LAAQTNRIYWNRFSKADEETKQESSLLVELYWSVINRKIHAISRWTLSLGANFPMALDEPDHRLFVASRAPARLAVLNAQSGRTDVFGR
jgi:hypothetical protein